MFNMGNLKKKMSSDKRVNGGGSLSTISGLPLYGETSGLLEVDVKHKMWLIETDSSFAWHEKFDFMLDW